MDKLTKTSKRLCNEFELCVTIVYCNLSELDEYIIIFHNGISPV